MTTAERGKNLWATFTADMAGYVEPGINPWSSVFLRRLVRQMYVHPGAWAIVIYRYGQWVHYRCNVPVLRQLLQLHYHYLFCWARFTLQIELPFNADIGPGLRIYHYGGIIINSKTVAGCNLGLNHGVVIGAAKKSVPCLGDNVDIGVGSKLFGPVILGNNVQVGAGAIVTRSFPDNAVIAGVPAKLLRMKIAPDFDEKPL